MLPFLYLLTVLCTPSSPKSLSGPAARPGPGPGQLRPPGPPDDLVVLPDRLRDHHRHRHQERHRARSPSRSATRSPTSPSKAGFGLLIYNIARVKSEVEGYSPDHVDSAPANRRSLRWPEPGPPGLDGIETVPPAPSARRPTLRRGLSGRVPPRTSRMPSDAPIRPERRRAAPRMPMNHVRDDVEPRCPSPSPKASGRLIRLYDRLDRLAEVGQRVRGPLTTALVVFYRRVDRWRSRPSGRDTCPASVASYVSGLAFRGDRDGLLSSWSWPSWSA